MAPVNTLAKSLVDVSLGALAFLCAQNRATIQATKMLAALSVYVGDMGSTEHLGNILSDSHWW